MVSSLHLASLPSAQHSSQRMFLEAKAGPTMPRVSPQPGEPVLTAPCLQAPRCGKTLHHITQLSAGSLHGSHTGLLAGVQTSLAPGHWLLLSPLPGTLFLKSSLLLARNLPSCHSLSERHSWTTPYKTALIPSSIPFPYHFIFLYTIYHPWNTIHLPIIHLPHTSS